MQRKNTRVDGKRTGENLEDITKRADFSISDVAEKLDVTANAVRNYIKGFNLPDTERMYNLCKLLDVDIKDIIVEKAKEELPWEKTEECRE